MLYPIQVYYMFAVLNFAELGSWDEVKIHGPQALKEYHQFMREIPMDERVSSMCLRHV